MRQFFKLRDIYNLSKIAHSLLCLWCCIVLSWFDALKWNGKCERNIIHL